MWDFESIQGEQFARWRERVRYVRSKPSWVVKWALIAAAVAVIVPVAALVILGVVVGLMVFAVLSVAAWCVAAVESLLNPRHGGGLYQSHDTTTSSGKASEGATATGGGATSGGRVNVRVIPKE